MTDHDETRKSPAGDPNKTSKEPQSLVSRLRQIYEDRPVAFAVGLIGVSALLFLCGGILSGDVRLPFSSGW